MIYYSLKKNCLHFRIAQEGNSYNGLNINVLNFKHFSTMLMLYDVIPGISYQKDKLIDLLKLDSNGCEKNVSFLIL
jgi:hypothetical protein